MEDNRSSSGKSYTVQSKRWIVRLLAVCSTLALILYFSWQPDAPARLQSASLLDDLIRDTLENYHVPVHRIRTQTIAIDSLNSRRVYTIAVPPEFSKTEWHYELDKAVRPYKIETPGRVHFPQKDLHIHLLYNRNIVRTVRLQTRSEEDL